MKRLRGLRRGGARRLARTAAAAALCVLGSAGCAAATRTAPAPPSPALAARLDAVLDTPPFDQAQWGVLAVEAATGRVIYQRRAAGKFIPASNMKLPVAAAALHYLGPTHRFETALRAAGRLEPATGELLGDLVLVGAGDPTLSRRFWGDDRAPLRALADSLRAGGVRSVAGSLVVDASGWDSVTAAPSWMVEDLSGIATGGAFVLAEGVTTVVVEAAAVPGAPAQVTWWPFGEDDFVVSRVETVAPEEAAGAAVRVAYHPESRRLVLDGRLPAGSVDTLRLGTRDPVRQAAAALARALAEAGIEVRGGWRVAWTPGEPLAGGCASGALDACGAATVARLAAPPLPEILGVMLLLSQNWLAEQLVRTLGPHAPPAPGADAAAPPSPRAGWPAGLAATRRFLVDAARVDSLDLLLRDGSGLSTQNLLTPRALVRLLDHAARAPWGDALRAALPEPGREGTLETRLLELEGRLFAKTGTLTNVTTLSGTLVRSDGTTVLFSILSNASGLPASRVRQAIDELVRALAEG